MTVLYTFLLAASRGECQILKKISVFLDSESDLSDFYMFSPILIPFILPKLIPFFLRDPLFSRPEFSDACSDRIVFDAVICNTDRHYGNFGFPVDNHTNKITMPAPLFDHGNSLFHDAENDDPESDDSLSTYANTPVPCVYNAFFSMAQKVMTAKHRKGLRHLLDFKFKKHSRYNLPAKQLKRINHQVHLREQKFLDGRE